MTSDKAEIPISPRKKIDLKKQSKIDMYMSFVFEFIRNGLKLDTS